jgi:hypothetical protein
LMDRDFSSSCQTKEEALEDLEQEAENLLEDYNEAAGIYRTAIEEEEFFKTEWRDAANRLESATRRFKTERSCMKELAEKLKALDPSLFSPTAPEPWQGVYARSEAE